MAISFEPVGDLVQTSIITCLLVLLELDPIIVDGIPRTLCSHVLLYLGGLAMVSRRRDIARIAARDSRCGTTDRSSESEIYLIARCSAVMVPNKFAVTCPPLFTTVLLALIKHSTQRTRVRP